MAEGDLAADPVSLSIQQKSGSPDEDGGGLSDNLESDLRERPIKLSRRLPWKPGLAAGVITRKPFGSGSEKAQGNSGPGKTPEIDWNMMIIPDILSAVPENLLFHPRKP